MRIVRACVRFSETINIELFSESQPSVAKKVERERESQTGERARRTIESMCCKASAIIETIDGCVLKGEQSNGN